MIETVKVLIMWRDNWRDWNIVIERISNIAPKAFLREKWKTSSLGNILLKYVWSDGNYWNMKVNKNITTFSHDLEYGVE